MPNARDVPLDKVAQVLTRGGNSPEQRRRASLVACDRIAQAIAPADHLAPGAGYEDPNLTAELAAHAAPVLELLGLIEPGTPSPKRWDSVPVVHGTRSAVDWHERQPLPHHRQLCPACIRYSEVQDRSAKRPKLRAVDGG